MSSLWALILTLAYITKRLSDEEKKERDLIGGQTALLIYSEGRGLHTSDPLPFPAPSSRVRLLHQPSPAWIGSHPRLPPPTGFHRLRHLARLWPWPPTIGFHYLPPPCAPVGHDKVLPVEQAVFSIFFSGPGCDWVCDAAVVLNESPVKVCKS